MLKIGKPRTIRGLLFFFVMLLNLWRFSGIITGILHIITREEKEGAME